MPFLRLEHLRRLANWALHRWRFVVVALFVNLVALSAWTTRAPEPLGLPIAELLVASLLVNLALLWATLLADQQHSRRALWRRFGPLPEAVQALVAATLLLALVLAGLVCVDGLVGILAGTDPAETDNKPSVSR